MHCQFVDAIPEKTKTLIKASDINDLELLNILYLVEQNCHVCLKYKKNKLRPFVRFSLSKDFNDVIAADLNGILILHMVDHATRCSWCSAVAVVKSKKKEEVDAYMRHWNPILETPGTILSDNVREFNNDLFHVLRKQFNINVKAIPGESLLSNGIVKCHNAVLKKIVNKLMLDENIAWAVSAKNTLHTFL